MTPSEIYRLAEQATGITETERRLLIRYALDGIASAIATLRYLATVNPKAA